MKRAIAHLNQEHATARLFLAALEAHLDLLHDDPTADSREASALFEYLAEIFFVKHEEKEETVLLPELIRLRSKIDQDVLRLLREQHHRGKNLLDNLWKALRPGQPWSDGEREEYMKLAGSWLRFLRGHLRYEEEFLFPHFEQELDEELDALLMKEFVKIDDDYEHVPDAAHLQDAAEEFARRYPTCDPTRLDS